MGKIPSEQGLKEASSPPKKATKRKIKANCLFYSVICSVSPVLIFNVISLINSSILNFPLHQFFLLNLI